MAMIDIMYNIICYSFFFFSKLLQIVLLNHYSIVPILVFATLVFLFSINILIVYLFIFKCQSNHFLFILPFMNMLIFNVKISAFSVSNR